MDKSMNSHSRLPALGQIAPLALGLLVLGCSGGGSGGGGGGSIQVQSLNLAANSIWAINRPITIEFSSPVDFSTVNLNSINIRQISGTPAVGEFSLINPTTVQFQPLCPRLPDFSDSGLNVGGVEYEMRLVGNSPYSVRSTTGAALTTSEQRLFSTPNTLDPAGLFFDDVAGSPVPIVRLQNSTETEASYVEVGGDPAARVYFERILSGPGAGTVALAGGFQLPLNLLSDPTTKLAFMIVLNQPIDPSAANLSSSRIRVRYLDTTTTPTWKTISSLVTLVENCAGRGSLVRIEPLGSLPPGTELRCFIEPEFRDLVGETNSVTQSNFAPSSTLAAAGTIGDSLEEEFNVGGTAPGSREELNPPLGLPVADWGNGSLSTAFSFSGTGGPGGDFDWDVKAGQVFVLDTATTILVGGPNFAPTGQQVVVGGVLDLRNFRVALGGVLKIQGQTPVTILASGTVEIFGTIEISGTDSKGVSTLNTTNIPEPGAPGVAGGGTGGTGSPLTNASSPKGTNGQGAFAAPDLGGLGGQATFWTGGAGNVDARRGTGGGGGRFGGDQISPTTGIFDQTFIGLDAEPGFNNLFTGSPPPTGVVTGQFPPVGGAVGVSPFTDNNANNNFIGSVFDTTTSTVIAGELTRPWAGAGGGGGGDAIWSSGTPFPVLPFNPGEDEKGAGGGGGGGSLQILSLGKITFGAAGRINCRGGAGGGGENTNFVDRVGGGSGAGSGGHVILQTASKIDFSLATSTTQISILATGGQGGAGMGNQGGAQIGPGGAQETTPLADACPPGFPTTQCRGVISGAGGDGSPGVIQLHTPNGLLGQDILLPGNRTLFDLCKPRPVAASLTQRLIPSFGRSSVARSLWIPLGLSAFDPTGSPAFKVSTFDFGDVNTATGQVLTTNGVVNLGPPLLGPATIAVGPTLPFIDPSGRTIFMDATPLIGGAQEYFVNNPGLLKRSTLRLSQVGQPTNNVRFDVVSVVLDTTLVTPRLKITTSSSEAQLTSFSAPGGVAAELIPTYFRVKTNGVLGSLPNSAAVFLKFQVAPETPGGVPDTAAAVPPTPGSDVSVINAAQLAGPNPPRFRFVRFQVEFDIDRLNTGITPLTPLPSLDFLRLPFRH